jgi:hypothetical protein
MKLFRLLTLAVACAAPALALAQWQWVDKTGRKVFSDQPPPPDIPASSILRQPGGRAVAPDPAPQAEAAKPGTPPAPKITGKDPALEEKRKRAEAAEAEKAKAEEEKLAQGRAENCQKAKRAKATLDSGMRISRVNDKGEREVLDDAARDKELKSYEAAIARDCAPAQ